MGWLQTFGGRMKSDYSCWPSIYKSFPWRELTPAKEAQITALAQAVLEFPHLTLDNLYDPDAMPPVLRRAHEVLDHAIDRLYRRSGFRFERERVEHLFQLFEQQAAPLDATFAARPRGRRPSR